MQLAQESSYPHGTARRSAPAHALRRWAVASLAGGGAGLVVGGIGGRLFMALLAGLNREDHGVVTSDGFEMGEVSVLGTLNLLLLGTVIGVLGGGLYLVLRDLRTGPRWFDTACVVTGATVVVGAVMVHADGPDFTLLEPTWAALALTLAVPATYALLMPPLVERWLRDDSGLMTGTSRWPLVALAPWAFPLFLLTPVLAGGWWARRRLAARSEPWAVRLRRTAPWIGRALLVVLFALSLVQLVGEIAEIYEVVGDGRFA